MSGITVTPCDKQLCKHNVHVCPRCIMEQESDIIFIYHGEETDINPKWREDQENGRIEKGIYCQQCFYCILEGEQLIYHGYEPTSIYADATKYSRCAYLIGKRDGYSKKALPEMKCQLKDLEKIYIDGYDAGKTMRELEDRTASFCTLLPDFLAKTKGDPVPTKLNHENL